MARFSRADRPVGHRTVLGVEARVARAAEWAAGGGLRLAARGRAGARDDRDRRAAGVGLPRPIAPSSTSRRWSPHATTRVARSAASCSTARSREKRTAWILLLGSTVGRARPAWSRGTELQGIHRSGHFHPARVARPGPRDGPPLGILGSRRQHRMPLWKSRSSAPHRRHAGDVDDARFVVTVQGVLVAGASGCPFSS